MMSCPEQTNDRAAAILRAFVSRDVRLLMRAFITYVRLIVEYKSPTWSPSSVGDIESVERVQRRFTKRLPGLRNMSYDQRFKFLDVNSLELRRLCADLYWCYKIIFGFVAVTSDVFFTKNSCTSILAVTSTNCINIILQLCIRSNFFLLNGLSMRGTICPKALILARCPNSNERLNGFDLATLGFS